MEIVNEHFELCRKIGRGAQGRIFLVQEFVEGTDFKPLSDEAKTFTEAEAKQYSSEPSLLRE